MQLARAFLATSHDRWIAYEIIASHPPTYQEIYQMLVEELGTGIDSWWTVDAFGSTLAGPAWRDGLIDTPTIEGWARSPDRWWRRAALVSTVSLNVRSRGGQGDPDRTLGICEMLVDDHDDMVVKALSWALRELIIHDRAAVEGFLDDHAAVLAARVKREVRNKLTTGLKNP